METRSFGTGVCSLKLSANFFRSFSLISLSFLALVDRACSTFFLCWTAKVLNAEATSRSTVAVAFGGPSLRTSEVLQEVDDGAYKALGLASGVAVAGAAKLDSAVVGGVIMSTLVVLGAGAALLFSTTALSGRANCEDMIAGSTGAPMTVICPVGGLRAGGVYLLFEDESGGKSCLRTPLYLFWR